MIITTYLNTCKYLEEVGFSVTYLGVDSYGTISLEELKKQELLKQEQLQKEQSLKDEQTKQEHPAYSQIALLGVPTRNRT